MEELWAVSTLKDPRDPSSKTVQIPARSHDHAVRMAPALHGIPERWRGIPEVHAAMIRGFDRLFGGA
jgi:hypothetical protein